MFSLHGLGFRVWVFRLCGLGPTKTCAAQSGPFELPRRALSAQAPKHPKGPRDLEPPVSPLIMENQMEKKLENEMEPATYRVI